MSTKFDSEGFDLTAAASTNIHESSSVIYEIGGGVTADLPPSSPPDDEPTSKSEALKEIGNEHFRQGRHLDAIDYYTDAIEAAPYDEAGPTGAELLRLKLEFDEAQREARAERHRFEMEKRRGGLHDDTTAKRMTNKPMWGN
jgi:tetratricopeptide (TPR) repeat protein